MSACDLQHFEIKRKKGPAGRGSGWRAEKEREIEIEGGEKER